MPTYRLGAHERYEHKATNNALQRQKISYTLLNYHEFYSLE